MAGIGNNRWKRETALSLARNIKLHIIAPLDLEAEMLRKNGCLSGDNSHYCDASWKADEWSSIVQDLEDYGNDDDLICDEDDDFELIVGNMQALEESTGIYILPNIA